MGLHSPPTSDLSELFHRGQITAVRTKGRLKFMQTALATGNGSTVLEIEQNVVDSMRISKGDKLLINTYTWEQLD
jgi:hypothetical protein